MRYAVYVESSGDTGGEWRPQAGSYIQLKGTISSAYELELWVTGV